MSSANRIYFFLSGLMPFIYFSYLIALAGTSSTVLNRSEKTGYCSLVPNCRGKSLLFFFFFLAVLGLSCGIWDLVP